jgi:putative transcriptional regulator
LKLRSGLVGPQGLRNKEKRGGNGDEQKEDFWRIVEGVVAMKSHREGKITLRTYKVKPAPLPKVDSKLIRDTRKRLRCSRALFARRLRINERTLEKWEQGRANPQAAALVLLVRKYPDTLKRLERLAAG